MSGAEAARDRDGHEAEQNNRHGAGMRALARGVIAGGDVGSCLMVWRSGVADPFRGAGAGDLRALLGATGRHDEAMTADAGSAAHWDGAYDLGDTTRSWFQDRPNQSLRMFEVAGVCSADSVIDVGGGASTLVDALLARGFADVTVVDISVAGLGAARQRLGVRAGRADWVLSDLLTWQPPRTYTVWHDRAVFHFLTTARARGRYVDTLRLATAPGSVAVFGCFAPDGPQSCSGLPVSRYDARGLSEQLGADWAPITEQREVHGTPSGGTQPFTWAAFRRQP